MLRVLDLFSGIGGFSLGLERTGGFETVAFCERDEYCRAVLARHWPGVPCFPDVRELTAKDVGPVDIITAGFPCQDASVANQKGIGSAGERTGLFREAARLCRDLGCGRMLLENVPGLLNRGFGDVLGALAEIGLDAEWSCFAAGSVGAPHKRERLWIYAHARGAGLPRPIQIERTLKRAQTSFAIHDNQAFRGWRSLVADIGILRGRDGLPLAMERRRIGALGNSIVPQIAEIIGQAILESEGQ